MNKSHSENGRKYFSSPIDDCNKILNYYHQQYNLSLMTRWIWSTIFFSVKIVKRYKIINTYHDVLNLVDSLTTLQQLTTDALLEPGFSYFHSFSRALRSLWANEYHGTVTKWTNRLTFSERVFFSKADFALYALEHCVTTVWRWVSWTFGNPGLVSDVSRTNEQADNLMLKHNDE